VHQNASDLQSPTIGFELKRSLSDMRHYISLYIQEFSGPTEVAQFEPHLQPMGELLDAMKPSDGVSTLRATVGCFLRDDFCYLFNRWTRYIYLPVTHSFCRIVFNAALLDAMNIVQPSNPKFWKQHFRPFLDLQWWFLTVTNPDSENDWFRRRLDLAIEGAELQSQKHRWRRSPTNPFVATILPRLRELKERRRQYEFCHGVSDIIGSFVMQLRQLYQGPLPAIYRGGQFNLEDRLPSLIGEWSEERLDARFPVESGPIDSEFDTRAVKAFMRESFELYMANFARQQRAEYERLHAPKYRAERHRLQREQTALKRRYEDELAKIADDADREVTRLAKEIDGVRAEKTRERQRQFEESAGRGRESLLAQIGEQSKRFAEIEGDAREAFRGLHVVLIKMRSHLLLEAQTIRVLKRRMGIPGAGDDGSGTYDLFETGRSARRICRELDRDWKKIDGQ
jgi:hypothetical protein